MVSTIETIDPKPFKHLIMTIGELPSSFVDSMSYYEMLAWLCDYLEKQVVPVVNNNSAVVAELKEYVENYFDNLDVQEEINNKLDAMAEAGTLQEIITTYIQANVAWTFDTVADMKASTNLIDGSYARTLGFNSVNDGGGALYKITDTGTANEMDVIAVGSSLYAHLIMPSILTPEMLGATGTGTETSILARTFEIGKNIKFGNDYTIDSKIDILSNTVLDGNLHTVTNNTSINFFRANTQTDIVIKNVKLTGDNTTTDAQIGFNFINCERVTVEKIYVSSTGGDGVSFSECTDCVLKDSKLSDNLISAFAYNSKRIAFENIDVYKPRFQYGIQFKSCNDSTMRGIYVDTPKDCGIYVNKGNEVDADDPADININDVTVINQGAEGTITSTLRTAIVLANGTRFNINNANILNSTHGGLYVSADNTSINNVNIDTANAGIVVYSNNVKITNSFITNCSSYGIQTIGVKDFLLNNSVLIDNSTDVSHANLILDGSSDITITNNMFEHTDDGGFNNILTKTSIGKARISNNVFTTKDESGSYADYRGVYNFAQTTFKNNGSCRFNGLNGLNIRCTAEWDNGGLIISDFRTAIPPSSYTAFSAGDKFLNKTGSGYIGWVFDGTNWHGYGAIVS